MNETLHRRANIDNQVKELIAKCCDRSWMLEHNDIVYINRDPMPFKVYRIGYGDYERQVRVARLGEDTTVWASGRWVFTDECFNLEVGHQWTATQEYIDASEQENKMPKGQIYAQGHIL